MKTALDTCLACRFASCTGTCLCTADPERRGVEVLVELHACPKEKFPARGAGDVVAKVTNALGIKKCGGCAKRQKALNRLLPARPPAESA